MDLSDEMCRYPGNTHAERLAARTRMIAAEYTELARERKAKEQTGMARFRAILRGDES